MCGIVGLFLKDETLQPRLGGWLAQMLTVMSDRGPDSAGFAVYRAPDADHIRFTLRAPPGGGFGDLVNRMGGDLNLVFKADLRDFCRPRNATTGEGE